ncbi:MAG: nuclear transport factor 2 family protein, partial [Azoarcus sp.]|nr:nuclear transport factor 2 family protein [Azoarcus sp.]
MTPNELADRYFACITARDIDGLAALYEDDATFALPDGREFQGKADIRSMHQSVFTAASPVP